MIQALAGVLILIADLWAILQVLRSRTGGGAKAAWVLAIVFLPVLGLLVWLVAGPRGPAV